MNRNSKYKKIVAVATATSLVVTSLVGCQSNTNNAATTSPKAEKEPVSQENTSTSNTATKDGVASKEETVYVKADATGATNSIIVSNWLKNGNGSTVIDDISNLKDIVNVKGEEAFTADGANVNWAANGADIYYQGTSEEALPVQLKITYTLDGKEIAPSELAGKSGHVKIRFDYTNTAKQTVKVDGKDVEIVVPFAVLGGTLLDSEKFTNVTVTNGKVISDGNNTIVAGIALPGLQESLIDGDSDLLKDVEIPNYIEMEADVTDFELGMTMSVVLNNLLKDIDAENLGGVDELKDKIDEMTSSYDKIVSGAEELSGYMEDLVKGVDKLADGASQLTEGSPKLNDAASTIGDGIGTAKDGSKDLVSGSKQLYAGAKELKGYTSQIVDGVAGVQDAIDQFISGFKGTTKEKGLAQGANELSNGAKEINEGVGQLQTGLGAMYKKVTDTITQNNADMQDLNTKLQTFTQLDALKNASGLNTQQQAIYNQLEPNIDAIKAGIAQLQGANAALQQIKSTIDSQEMVSKVSELKDGTQQLEDGSADMLTGVNKLYSGNKLLKKKLVTLKTGVDGIDDGAKKLSVNLKTLYKGTLKLDAGLDKLNTGTSEFKKALITYSEGVGTLGEGVETLQSSTVKLSEGAKTLYDGTKEFKEQAMDKLSDAIDKNFDNLKEKLTAVVKADQSYDTFSGANENMESSVKFIIETEEITTK